MAGLRLLVENLVLIIVLAVFLEMLLPAGNLRRYVHLVAGLMIIVAVLQAVTGVLGRGLAVNLPFIDHAPPDMRQALRAGEQMARSDQRDAVDGYREALERQVRALASLKGNLVVEGVMVDVQGDRASPSFGGLTGVTVRVRAGAGTPDSRAATDVAALRRELADFYNLKPEAVSVELEKGGS